MFDLAREILQTLSHNKLRTALTGLAVAWGIFMLIVLVALGRGVTDDFVAEMMTESGRKITLFPGATSLPYGGYAEGRDISLKASDLQALETAQPEHIQSVNASIDGPSATISSGSHSITASYTGVYPVVKNLNKVRLKAGRFISREDLDRRSKVMVMDIDQAKTLFPPDGADALGKRVTHRDLSWTIIGLYESNWMRDLFVPYTTAAALAEDKDNLGVITVVTKDLTTDQEARQTEDIMRQTMARAHQYDPNDRSAVWIWNAVANSLQMNSVLGVMNTGVWVLGLLTLLSGVIGISNIMFVSVKERTHEIGIRRAIGARPFKILLQILSESVAITVIFGYIGIVVGALAVAGLSTVTDGMMTRNLHVDLSLAAQVTVVLVVAGALAGLFPALKALKVKPVEALRQE